MAQSTEVAHRVGTRKIDLTRLARLVEENGIDREVVAEFAATTRVHVDSVWRVLREDFGIRRPPVHAQLTPEAEERIRLLCREGLPAGWIAEEFKVSPNVVRHRRPVGAPDIRREWSEVWPSIFNDPVLLALHYSFAPPTDRQLVAARVLEAA
jgi:hypothetical protein